MRNEREDADHRIGPAGSDALTDNYDLTGNYDASATLAHPGRNQSQGRPFCSCAGHDDHAPAFDGENRKG